MHGAATGQEREKREAERAPGRTYLSRNSGLEQEPRGNLALAGYWRMVPRLSLSLSLDACRVVSSG